MNECLLFRMILKLLQKTPQHVIKNIMIVWKAFLITLYTILTCIPLVGLIFVDWEKQNGYIVIPLIMHFLYLCVILGLILRLL